MKYFLITLGSILILAGLSTIFEDYQLADKKATVQDSVGHALMNDLQAYFVILGIIMVFSGGYIIYRQIGKFK